MTNCTNAGIALLSIAKVMITEGVCARAAASNKYDDLRLRYMMNEGLDGALAKSLLETEPSSMITVGDA